MTHRGWLSALAATLLLVAQSPSQTTILNFSTYLGGGGEDTIRDLTTDAAGNIYVVGGTGSPGFPVTLGPGFNASGCSTLGTGGPLDVFVTKFSPSGQIVWSRLLGGPCYDRAYAVELDGAGNIYVAGRAGDGFPTTAGALQPAFGGDTVPVSLYGRQDGFITKLDSSGSVLWSTYFGAADMAIIRDIAVDPAGNVYPVLQGATTSLPHVTAGAFRTTLLGGQDMVVAKLTTHGQLVWGTYYGGSGLDGVGASIRVDSSGHPVVLGVTTSNDLLIRNAYQGKNAGGNDFALAKFTPDGSALVFGTYLGGSGDEGVETHHLALGRGDTIYLTGIVRSGDFPTTPDAYQRSAGGGIDVGLASFSPNGELLASSFFGGAGTDGVQGVDVDAAGNVVYFGATTTSTFNTEGAYQTSLNGSAADAYVVKLSPDLSQSLYVTYFGGRAADQGRAGAVARAGTVIFGGQTASGDYPVKDAHDASYGGGGSDAIVTSLTLPGTPTQTPPPPTPRNLVIIR